MPTGKMRSARRLTSSFVVVVANELCELQVYYYYYNYYLILSCDELSKFQVVITDLPA